MSTSNPNDPVFAKIAEGLEYTSRLVSTLLEEIKNSESDFTAIKTELSYLRENVKGLSSIVTEGNETTSLVTQVALIQQRVESIDKWVKEHASKHQLIKNSFSGLEDKLNEFESRLEKLEQIVKEQSE